MPKYCLHEFMWGFPNVVCLYVCLLYSCKSCLNWFPDKFYKFLSNDINRSPTEPDSFGPIFSETTSPELITVRSLFVLIRLHDELQKSSSHLCIKISWLHKTFKVSINLTFLKQAVLCTAQWTPNQRAWLVFSSSLYNPGSMFKVQHWRLAEG